MKGLLHSKRFKKNLGKWLIMYVGAMALLTTVVTYSRYITNLGVNDSSRAAKFDVAIIPNTDPNGCKTIDKNTNCETETLLPNSDLIYEFDVKTELEVKTALAVTISILDPSNFKITKIEDITDKNDIKVISEEDTNVKSITSTVDENTNGVTKYRVTVVFTGKGSNGTFIPSKDLYEIIKVGYSAEQIK